MVNIQADRILRVHAPGYGVNGCFKESDANALDSYDVLVINPLSIIHLFETSDSEIIQQIDLALSQGLTNFNVSSDIILTDITKQLGKRIFELIEFLKKGGLLVYYLCRPFIIQGPTRNLDNYVWLNVLAPDMGGQEESENPSSENTARHMSAISHGRNIDVTEDGQQSDFSEYFKQPGLEWNTIIRENYLTEGYNSLATAGSMKCISAYLLAGNNGGSIVFLPAPYSPDFDKVLIDCIDKWYAKRYNLSVASQGSKEESKPALKTDNNDSYEKPQAFSDIEQKASDTINTTSPQVEQKRISNEDSFNSSIDSGAVNNTNSNITHRQKTPPDT